MPQLTSAASAARPANRRLRWILPLIAAALIAAACSSNVAVSTEEGAETPSVPTADANASTDGGNNDDDDDDGDDDGVGATSDGSTQEPTATAIPAAEPGNPDDGGTQPDTGEFPEIPPPTLDLASCGDLLCGTVIVPVNYANPDGDTLEIAVSVRPADDPDARIGYLFVNPGGPGGSAIESLVQAAEFAFPTELLDAFDIIGVDPRGVGESEPTWGCGEPFEQLNVLLEIDLPVDTPAEVQIMEDAVALCVETMGSAAGQIGTDQHVRDIDQVRRALGEEQISYLGYSYGSTVGVWYATLFPDHVRAMVVDGADDPIDFAATPEEAAQQAIDEIRAFGDLLEDALDACDEDCPIYNDGFPVAYFEEAAQKLSLVDEAFGGEPFAGTFGVVSFLYNENSWPQLWEGLFQLNENDDPSILAESAEFQVLPGEVNITGHVFCLDDWALYPELDREARLASGELALELGLEQVPLFFENLTYEGFETCPYLDTIAPAPLGQPLDGSDVPILVIGNVSDPATPFTESKDLVDKVLSNGFLLETDHYKHTVYPENDCVVGIVHDVLLEQTFPDSKTITCDREELDYRELLVDLCFQLAGDIDDDQAVACDDFADAVFEEIPEDDIAALFGGDDSAAPAIGTILFGIFDDYGIVPDL